MKLYLQFILIFVSLATIQAQNSTNFKNAEKQYKAHNYQKAIEFYQKSIDEYPKNSYISGQIAFAYLFLEKYEEAKINFQEALLKDSTISDYYNGLGLAKAYLGDVGGAANDFTEAIKLDPTFSQPYLNRGSAYSAMNKLDSAITDLESAEKLDSKNPEINFQLARMLYKKEEYEKSIKNYNIAEQKGLKSDDLYLSRASVYYKMKNIPKAIDDYSIILKKNPKSTDALNNRAVLYDQIGKKDLADKDRNTLYSITGVRFKDPREYKYEKIESKNGYFTIEVPTHWIVESTSSDSEDRIVITVPQKKENPKFNAVNITLSFNYNMALKYGVSREEELVQFWQNSQIKNTENYKEYDLISQKQFMLNGWKATNFLTQSQIDDKSPKINMYELVTAKPNQLFYGYFQSLTEDFKYYQPIFDKIIKTINIKGN